MTIKTILNGYRDLAQDDRIRRYIGQHVEILHRLQNGLFEIVTDDGKVFHVAKYNLG